MNTAYRLILIVLFGFFLATCQKEMSQDTGGPVIPGPNPVTVTASVSGRVINELGDPVAGAMVKAGTSMATTDINGEFSITNAQLVDKAAYVTVNKSGYFEGSRTFIARQGLKHFVEIQLMPKIEVGSINGTTGGAINLGNGSSITLPANGVIVQSTGAAYTGAVKVSMTWIDPTSKDLLRQMPGDLRGTDANNNEVGMESYGMLGVELNSTSGEKLQIASGKKATLKFPLPSSIQGSAPATIALWSFDESKGLWKQEGTATKSGSSYIADVSHFSWWNCDMPITTAAYFAATFVDQNGQPLAGHHVSVYRANGNYSGAHGLTDSAGYLIGRVPANEQLLLKVESWSPCYATILTQNIGPFTANSTNNLGNIVVTINNASLITLNGTATNCNSNPVTNGYVEVQSGWYTYRKPVINGSFTISFSNCNAAPVTYYVVDEANSQQSTPVTINATPGVNNVGAISACGISTNEYIDYTFDGQSVSLNNADSISAFGQSGTSLTQISGAGTGTTFNSIYFGFSGQGTGTFPLVNLFVNMNGTSSSFGNTGLTTVITSNGPGAGSYIEGSFSGAAVDSSLVTHTIQASFRVKRQ